MMNKIWNKIKSNWLKHNIIAAIITAFFAIVLLIDGNFKDSSDQIVVKSKDLTNISQKDTIYNYNCNKVESKNVIIVFENKQYSIQKPFKSKQIIICVKKDVQNHNIQKRQK